MDQLLVLVGAFAVPALGVVPAASEAEDISQLLWLLGPIGGVGFFMMVFLRYRNTNKRHAYERETSAEMLDMRTYDQRVSSVKGVRNSSIPGANHASPRSRLGNGTTVTVEEPPKNPIEQIVDQAGQPAPSEPQTPEPQMPQQSAPADPAPEQAPQAPLTAQPPQVQPPQVPPPQAPPSGPFAGPSSPPVQHPPLG